MQYRWFVRVCLGLGLLISVGSMLMGASCDPKRWTQQDVLGSGPLKSSTPYVLLARWRRSVEPDYRYDPLTWKLSPEETSRPVIDEVFHLVCVGSERQRITCIHNKTGRLMWSFQTQGRILAQPIIHDRILYVGTTSGVMYALETRRHKKHDNQLSVHVKWKYASDGEILSRAAYLPAEGPNQPALILFTTSNNKITALQAETGKWEWQQRHDPPDRLSIRGQAPPVIHQKQVFTGYSDGTAISYIARTGKEVWSKSLKENDQFPDIDGAPTIYDNRVYFASYSGSVHCLGTKDGKPLWKYPMKGVSRIEQRDADLFLSTNDSWIVALNAENGKQRWKKRFREAGSFLAPVTDDQNLYVASTDNGIYVLRPDDGMLLQRVDYRVGFAEPVVHARTMYLLAFNSLLYSFKIFERPSAQ